MKKKIAICQFRPSRDKAESLRKSIEFLRSASKEGAKIVLFPEIFISPYEGPFFKEFAESPDGLIIKSLQNECKSLAINLVAGSIPEKEGDKIFNTSFIIDKNGEVIGKHRKAHLFDVDLPDVKTKESDTFSAGDSITTVLIEGIKIGVAICYDIRFPEFIRLYCKEGIDLLMLPAAFSVTTGTAHWKEVLKIRAVDNQFYIAASSPARDKSSIYLAYGHSLLSDPWGRILVEASIDEEILYATIDTDLIAKTKDEFPILKHFRRDLY